MSIGKTIKRLRQNMGITQEQLAEKLRISDKAVSKWENELALPDISLLPLLADCFCVSIDELMNYKMNSLSNKDRFVKLMVQNGILTFDNKSDEMIQKSTFHLNSEKFVSNDQIAKIGEFFADCIRENNIEFTTIVGLAYNGISFSVATACALFRKYGMTVNYCHDRKVADRRGRKMCGYELQKGDKVIIIDDFMFSGKTLMERMDSILQNLDVSVGGVFVIADRMIQSESNMVYGSKLIEEKYKTKVHSIITEKDIVSAIQRQIV